jgi:FtsH-binding integral membrane protein
MGGLINYALFLPPILLLFHRSTKALLWCLFLLALTIAALIISYISNPSALYSILGTIIIQGYICLYVYGLKKDNLLPNNDF